MATKVFGAVALLGFCSFGDGTPDSQPDPHEFRWAPRSYSASVRFGADQQVWEFQGTAEGIFVNIGRSGEEKRVKLESILTDRKITRIVATSVETNIWTHTRMGECMYIGLGVESLSENGKHLEYRMMIALGWSAGEEGLAGRIQSAFRLSPLLITRPLDQPFDAMAVGLLGGDSLMLTLQDVKRKGDTLDDSIETHTFVDHCPSPQGVVLRHYVSNGAKVIPKSK